MLVLAALMRVSWRGGMGRCTRRETGAQLLLPALGLVEGGWLTEEDKEEEEMEEVLDNVSEVVIEEVEVECLTLEEGEEGGAAVGGGMWRLGWEDAFFSGAALTFLPPVGPGRDEHCSEVTVCE